jgi:excisionase family DNA binding protein
MTVKQAAERLEISCSLCYRLIEEGRLPHRRIGKTGCRGKIVLTEEGIAAFLRRCEVATDER